MTLAHGKLSFSFSKLFLIFQIACYIHPKNPSRDLFHFEIENVIFGELELMLFKFV